jgi:hypothetical protein
MAPKGRDGDSKRRKGVVSLREQGYKEVLELLKLAEKSSNPNIRAAAVEIAKQTSKYDRQQGARVSPHVALGIDTVFGVVTGLLCWYAFLHYPVRLAYELSAITVLLYLVIVAISLFLCELLSQGNLIKVFGFLVSHVKNWMRGSANESRHQDKR